MSRDGVSHSVCVVSLVLSVCGLVKTDCLTPGTGRESNARRETVAGGLDLAEGGGQDGAGGEEAEDEADTATPLVRIGEVREIPSRLVSVDTYNSAAGPRHSEDNRAYGSLETNTETDQTADTDASESNLSANRRRRSRRRRTDNDATLIDGESDNASVSENGIGKQGLFSHRSF